MVSLATRLVVLTLSICFGIVSMALGINALVKSVQSKNFVKSHAPPGVTVKIDTTDAISSGTVVTFASGLVALTSFLAALALLASHRANSFVKPRTLRLFSYVHFFLSTWTMAALIAYDIIARNRQAKVTAHLGNISLPQSIIEQQQAALGVSPVYWTENYVRWFAIIPWFTVLFGFLAGFSLFRASNDTAAANNNANNTYYVRDNEHTSPHSGAAATEMEEKDKERESIREERV